MRSMPSIPRSDGSSVSQSWNLGPGYRLDMGLATEEPCRMIRRVGEGLGHLAERLAHLAPLRRVQSGQFVEQGL